METEKIYLSDARCGTDAATMAMLTNGQQWNNPMMYLVWMMMAKWMNGDDSGNLRNAMQDNQNANLLMDAIKGNTSEIGNLATRLNCDCTALHEAICAVRGGIDKVAGEVGYSAEKVIADAERGNCELLAAIKDCCCTTQKEILRMGYESQLQAEKQNNLITAGFASIGFETKNQTCEILQNANSNTQRIIDTLNNHWNQELQLKYQDTKEELARLKTVNDLVAQLKPATTAA